MAPERWAWSVQGVFAGLAQWMRPGSVVLLAVLTVYAVYNEVYRLHPYRTQILGLTSRVRKLVEGRRQAGACTRVVYGYACLCVCVCVLVCNPKRGGSRVSSSAHAHPSLRVRRRWSELMPLGHGRLTVAA